jgi:hypothetical protein
MMQTPQQGLFLASNYPLEQGFSKERTRRFLPQHKNLGRLITVAAAAQAQSRDL